MAKTASSKELMRLQTELNSLKAENARLKNARATESPKRRPIQASLSIILLTFSVVFILIANIFLWAGNTVFNTANYVKAVGPVIQQPEVQTAIANIATQKIFDNINTEAYLVEVLPPRAAFLAPQLNQQLRGQVESNLSNALASERLQSTWLQVNERQHARILSFINNYEGDGNISVSQLYDQLQARFVGTPLGFLADKELPDRVSNITVIDAPRLPVLHNISTNLGLIRWLSLALAAVTLFAAMWLSRNRRRTYYIFAAGIVLSMLSTLIALRVAQASAASNVQSQYADAARISAEIITSGLRTQSLLILGFAVLTVVATWISGSSRRALQLKDWFRSGVGSPLHDKVFKARAEKFTNFVSRYKRHLEWAVFIVATLILLAARLSVGAIIWWLVGLIILIALIEFLGAEPPSRKTK